jgi:agmatinase
MKKINNFGNLPPQYSNYKNSKIAIVPVPYDGTSTWIKGANRGPEAIISASVVLDYYDIATNSEVYKQGIFTDAPVREKSGAGSLVEEVRKRISRHIGNEKFAVVLGGEHTVSLGSVKAHAEKYKNLSVLQLDAHADMWDKYEGSKYNHACIMARVKDICPLVQAGIRSIDTDEKKNINEKRIFYAEKIRNQKNWQRKALKKLTGEVYITIDLDVFDPSILPSTGTPEPGGLGWYEVLEFLKKVIDRKEVVGFDVVELCPNRYAKSSDYLAAKLIYKLLSYKFK